MGGAALTPTGHPVQPCFETNADIHVLAVPPCGGVAFKDALGASGPGFNYPHRPNGRPETAAHVRPAGHPALAAGSHTFLHVLDCESHMRPRAQVSLRAGKQATPSSAVPASKHASLPEPNGRQFCVAGQLFWRTVHPAAHTPPVLPLSGMHTLPAPLHGVLDVHGR